MRATWLFKDTWVDTSSGPQGSYPADWSNEEIRHFALGAMANAPEKYPTLIRHATSEKQRQNIHEGVIEGAGLQSTCPCFRGGHSLA